MDKRNIRKKGTKYELRDFKGEGKQFIQFNERLEDGTYVNGTTNEQVLSTLIRHLIHQNISNPDPLTQQAIDKLKGAQDTLRVRKDNTKQKVKQRYGKQVGGNESAPRASVESLLGDNQQRVQTNEQRTERTTSVS